MAIQNISYPDLTLREAAYNMALLVEHEKDAGSKSKRELYFGVYRSRSFIVITRSTSLLERIKRYVQWLIGWISYKQDAIDSLAARSRTFWIPANEWKAKNEQLEAAEKQAAKVKIAEAKLQKAEQDLQKERRDNVNWKSALQQVKNARTFYENLHRDLRNYEEEKDQKLAQKQKRINDLEVQIVRMRNDHAAAINEWQDLWDRATEDAKLRVAQARSKINEKERDLQDKDKRIKQLKDQVAELKKQLVSRETPAVGPAAPPPQSSSLIAAILEGQPPPNSQ